MGEWEVELFDAVRGSSSEFNFTRFGRETAIRWPREVCWESVSKPFFLCCCRG